MTSVLSSHRSSFTVIASCTYTLSVYARVNTSNEWENADFLSRHFGVDRGLDDFVELFFGQATIPAVKQSANVIIPGDTVNVNVIAAVGNHPVIGWMNKHQMPWRDWLWGSFVTCPILTTPGIMVFTPAGMRTSVANGRAVFIRDVEQLLAVNLFRVQSVRELSHVFLHL